MNKVHWLLSLLLIALLLSASFPLISMPSPASADGANPDWTIVPGGTTETLYGIWGSAANDIAAVGANGTILHWDGKTWTPAVSATSETFRAVWGSSSNSIFAVGSQSIIRHWDGNSWAGMSDYTSLDLSGVWGDSPTSVFAVGTYLLPVFHWDGHDWSYFDYNLEADGYHGIWGTAYTNFYVVGDSGRVHHYNGSSWNDIDIGASGATLNAVWGTSASDIYIAGNNGVLYHYNGSAWSSRVLSSAPLRSIWGASATNIFVTGDNGVIMHYDGSSWTATNTGTSKNINSVWGSSSKDIWAVGQDGTILRYGSSVKTSPASSGRGAVSFNVNTGFIDSVRNVSIDKTNCSRPVDYEFPYGLFSFNVTGIAAGATVKVTLKFAQPLPTNVKYYKCIDNKMVDCTSLMTRLDNYTLILNLTDGGLGDSDHSANGIIVDPGGPARYIASSTTQVYGQGTIPSATQQAPVALSNISVKSASLSTTKVGPGESVTVTANVANTGTANGTGSIKVYVNGELENSQGVTVSSGSSTPVTFTVSRSEPGTYDVYVGGTNAGSFTVDQFTPQTILIISAALVFFAFILGVIYMTRRKQAH